MTETPRRLEVIGRDARSPKKETPPFPGGVEKIYWMDWARALRGVIRDR
jgi:hypothetical protein